MQIAPMKNELISLNSESATNRLVLLHGWGADADDLIPVGRLLTDSLDIKFEIVSLSATQYHPNGSGRQWYALYPHDWGAVPNAVLNLERRVNNLATDQIPLEKTLLMGFSQGGAMALEIAKSLKLGGVFALSSYSHPDWSPKQNMPPVFLSHGNLDSVVSISESEKTFSLLKNYGIRSELYSFNGGHEITNDLISHLRRIIKNEFSD